jgi:hypothetical protein
LRHDWDKVLEHIPCFDDVLADEEQYVCMPPSCSELPTLVCGSRGMIMLRRVVSHAMQEKGEDEGGRDGLPILRLAVDGYGVVW